MRIVNKTMTKVVVVNLGTRVVNIKPREVISITDQEYNVAKPSLDRLDTKIGILPSVEATVTQPVNVNVKVETMPVMAELPTMTPIEPSLTEEVPSKLAEIEGLDDVTSLASEDIAPVEVKPAPVEVKPAPVQMSTAPRSGNKPPFGARKR